MENSTLLLWLGKRYRYRVKAVLDGYVKNKTRRAMYAKIGDIVSYVLKMRVTCVLLYVQVGSQRNIFKLHLPTSLSYV